MVDINKPHYRSINELLAAIRAGDQHAISYLYRFLQYYCYPSVQVYLINRGRQEVDAEDFFQEAFIILLKKIQANEFKLHLLSRRSYPDQLCAFVMQVVKNQMLKAIRWENRPPVLPEETYASQDELEYLFHLGWEEVLRMKKPCKELLIFKYGKKLNESEIGRLQLPKMGAKMVRNKLNACVLSLLATINNHLKKSRERLQLEKLALSVLEQLEEPCLSILSKVYLKENKSSMEEIAKEMGFKNANVAKVAKADCMKKLNLKIAESLLNE